jgi:hypothetical protein
MKKNKKNSTMVPDSVGSDFFTHFWDKSWTYIKTVVDVVREPVLILDASFCVMAANESFYATFHAKPKDTEGRVVYELGNGQWNIPALRQLLEEILPQRKVFKGFQVAHEFPIIGRKVMILNGRQIYVEDDASPKVFPPIILLAMEDVTEMMVVAESLAGHAKQIEERLTVRTQNMEFHIKALEKEVDDLKNRV